MTNKTIKSKRLILKKFAPNDFDLYLQLVNDKNVMKLITGKSLSKNNALIKFKNILRINEKYPGIGFYAIREIENQKFIGLGKIIQTNKNEAEIGYSLLPENWGKGFGSEISEKLVEYSKEIQSIKNLIAIIDPENIASKRILEKSHFKLYKVCDIDGLPSNIFKLIL